MRINVPTPQISKHALRPRLGAIPRYLPSHPSLSLYTSSARQISSGKKKPRFLEHHHLRGDTRDGLISYETAELFQDKYRARILAWKALPEHERIATEPPLPRVLTFESLPVITLGRRQGELTEEQTLRLQQDLDVHLPIRHIPVQGTFQPVIKKTSRGGLTTYHGPGQLIIWPIIDMHSPCYPKYGVATYAAHLESTTQRLLAQQFSIQTYTTQDEPGVWVRGSPGQAPRKIAALGVHHRRFTTALGIAINIDIPTEGAERVNPWKRFVPCGLEGKLVTSAAAELGVNPVERWNVPYLAERWVALFKEGLRDVSKRGENTR